MDQDITIRQAERGDLDGWIGLRAALWPEEPRAQLAESAARFFERPEPTLEGVLIAIASGQVVGFAELSRRPYAEGCVTSPVGFLEGWFVAPHWRRRGIGRALVAAADAWARERGCREFASDTRFDNTSGAAAHHALGFEEVEQLRCFRKSL